MKAFRQPLSHHLEATALLVLFAEFLLKEAFWILMCVKLWLNSQNKAEIRGHFTTFDPFKNKGVLFKWAMHLCIIQGKIYNMFRVSYLLSPAFIGCRHYCRNEMPAINTQTQEQPQKKLNESHIFHTCSSSEKQVSDSWLHDTAHKTSSELQYDLFVCWLYGNCNQTLCGWMFL